MSGTCTIQAQYCSTGTRVRPIEYMAKIIRTGQWCSKAQWIWRGTNGATTLAKKNQNNRAPRAWHKHALETARDRGQVHAHNTRAARDCFDFFGQGSMIQQVRIPEGHFFIAFSFLRTLVFFFFEPRSSSRLSSVFFRLSAVVVVSFGSQG